jgi:hypothetical protein
MVVTTLDAAEKRCCEWNRFCAFTGPFFHHRLFELERGQPLVVGRCYACDRYVCNRCAQHQPLEGSSVPASFGREVVCPADGARLGRGDEWVIFDSRSTSLIGAIPDLNTVLGQVGTAPGEAEPDPLVVEALRAAGEGDWERARELCIRRANQDPDRASASVIHAGGLGRPTVGPARKRSARRGQPGSVAQRGSARGFRRRSIFREVGAADDGHCHRSRLAPGPLGVRA